MRVKVDIWKSTQDETRRMSVNCTLDATFRANVLNLILFRQATEFRQTPAKMFINLRRCFSLIIQKYNTSWAVVCLDKFLFFGRYFLCSKLLLVEILVRARSDPGSWRFPETFSLGLKIHHFLFQLRSLLTEKMLPQCDASVMVLAKFWNDQLYASRPQTAQYASDTFPFSWEIN